MRNVERLTPPRKATGADVVPIAKKPVKQIQREPLFSAASLWLDKVDDGTTPIRDALGCPNCYTPREVGGHRVNAVLLRVAKNRRAGSQCGRAHSADVLAARAAHGRRTNGAGDGGQRSE